MSNTGQQIEEGKTYFVYGSGLMAVPYWRLNEIPKLKNEFHANEANVAMMAALARKIA